MANVCGKRGMMLLSDVSGYAAGGLQSLRRSRYFLMLAACRWGAPEPSANRIA